MHFRGNLFLSRRGFAISGEAFLLLVMIQLTWGIDAKSFTKTSQENGTVMCATEEPSLVFEPHQLTVQSTEATCVPLGMYCAWKCNLEPNCTNFNYREDTNRCELFFYSPSNCTSIQFCTHSEVKGLGSCRKQDIFRNVQDFVNPAEPSQQAGCSFPFTYNGRLLYNCTQNDTNSHEVGCFSKNRLWIKCPLSQLDYTAQNVTIDIDIPTFDIPTQVISVDKWIVVQQRIDSSTDFGRNWSEYRNGFGVYNFNYWMGLEKMHQLTTSDQYTLRIEVYYPTLRQWRSAEYSSFVIDAEANNYTLHVSGFTGDADNGLQWSAGSGKMHDGMQFSTPDVDNDKDPKRHCANMFSSGWWFNGCDYVNLNGLINAQTAASNYFEYYISGIKTAVGISRMMIQRV